MDLKSLMSDLRLGLRAPQDLRTRSDRFPPRWLALTLLSWGT